MVWPDGGCGDDRICGCAGTLKRVRIWRIGNLFVILPSPFIRKEGPDGGIGRHAGLKILWPAVAVPVRPRLRVPEKIPNSCFTAVWDFLFCTLCPHLVRIFPTRAVCDMVMTFRARPVEYRDRVLRRVASAPTFADDWPGGGNSRNPWESARPVPHGSGA